MTDELEYEAIEPEVVRGYYRELTRCDHCGALDQQTERHEIGGDFFWLHEYCRELFVRPYSEPVYNYKRVVGFIASTDGKQTWRATKWIGGRLINAGEFPTRAQAEYAAVRRDPFPQAPPGWFRGANK